MRSSRQISFLNGPNKLVFVRMYESTFTSLVGPPYCYCSLVAFCAFLCFFMLYCTHKKHSQAKIHQQKKKQKN